MFKTEPVTDFDGNQFFEVLWQDFVPKNVLSQIGGEAKSKGWWSAGKIKLRMLGRKTILLVSPEILNDFTFLTLMVLRRNSKEFGRYYQKQLRLPLTLC